MKLFSSLSCGLLVLIFSSVSMAAEKAGVLNWERSSFLQPESVVLDTSSERLFVSNINGQPMELNGKGYISVLTISGEVIHEKWVTDLNAPKGLAIYNGQLFIADQQTLHIVDIKTAEIVRSITLDQSKMLNDISVDNAGNIYVSDLIGGGIYRYQSGDLSLWISPEKFAHPNGVYFDGENLIVGTWGEGLNDDFSTDKLGSLFSIDLVTKQITTMKGSERVANIDGITQIEDSIYFSDWITGDIFEYRNESAKKLFNAGKGSADISALNDTLLVPMMMNGSVRNYTLK